MTNNLKDKINQTLMCYEASVYSELGEHYPVTNQNKWDRKKAIQHILNLINQKERELLERVEEAIGEDEAKNTNNMSVEERHKYFQWQVDHDGARDDLRSELRDRIKQLKEELNKEVK